MAKNFITNTASLKTTHADVRKLDVRKINLKGKNILDHIKDNVPIIKHANDTRETVTENDLWGQYIEVNDDGTITVHEDWVTNPNASNYSACYTSITKVEDNKFYIGEEGNTFFANIQTDRIKEGTSMFERCTNLISFTSDLSSLTDGLRMFAGCSNLSSYSSNLSNLTNGYLMFIACYGLTSFSSNLSNLTNGSRMFFECKNLNSFSSDLSSLDNGNEMFLLCSNLISFSSDLPSLTDGEYMFSTCTSLTLFSSRLSNLTNGRYMFYKCENLTSFSSELPSLTNGSYMFCDCPALTSFSVNLYSLTNGYGMFNKCTSLTIFSADLPSLTDGSYMFIDCSNLTSFRNDLPNLNNSNGMFNKCTSLTTFSADLPSLTNGGYMFTNCSNLASFISDLSNLYNGEYMFYGCENLTSFTSDLSSLIRGSYMFSVCKLDAKSVMYIAKTIKDIAAEKKLYQDGDIPYVTYDSITSTYSAPFGFLSDGRYIYTYNNYAKLYTTVISSLNVGKLTLGINVTNNADTIQQQLEDFAKDALFDSWAELKQAFVDKGWTVTFQYGGSDTNITLSEDEQFRGVPIYARLIEVSEEDKDTAEYCTEDGTNFYNIDWGHDVTDYDAYQHFGSLLEACGYFGVIPVKYLEEK